MTRPRTQRELQKRYDAIEARVKRAEKKLRKRCTHRIECPPTPCVVVRDAVKRRALLLHMLHVAYGEKQEHLALSRLCMDQWCVNAEHYAYTEAPAWAVQLEASLFTWRGQLLELVPKLKASSKRLEDLLNDAEDLGARIAVAEGRLADPEYTTGQLGATLGLRAIGPCVTAGNAVHDRLYNEILSARPANAFVCHRCDNRRCVNVVHLFWGTSRDNARDMVLKGRHRGGGRPLERLKEELEQVQLLIRLQ